MYSGLYTIARYQCALRSNVGKKEISNNEDELFVDRDNDESFLEYVDLVRPFANRLVAILLSASRTDSKKHDHEHLISWHLSSSSLTSEH